MVTKATPFHPPYALMISTAIRSLGGAEGSTAPSISGYIKANFAGLPRGHEKLLPYYLRKLTAQGEFAMGPGGRYVVVGDEAGPVAGRSDDEGVPIACEGDLVMEVRPIEAVPRPLRRGRPPKRNRGSDGGAGPVQSAGPPSSAVATAEADFDGSGAVGAGVERPDAPPTPPEGPMRKRRGRPPKGDHEAVRSSKDDTTKSVDRRSSEPDPEVSAKAQQGKRRLGRPPKSKPKSAGREEEEECLELMDSCLVDENIQPSSLIDTTEVNGSSAILN